MTVLDGPRKPYSIETIAAPMFGISIVIQSGLMRSMPFANRCSCARSSVCRPPMPVATAVPVRSPSPSAVDVEAGVVDRLARRHEHELAVAVGASSQLAVHGDRRIEVLDLAGEADRSIAQGEIRDRGAAAPAADDALPRLLAGVAERRDHSDAGQHDPASSWLAQSHRYIPSPPSTASTAPVTKPAASETRKRTQRAMSSGSPSRPSGVDESSASRALSGSTSVSSVAT